MQVDTRKHPQSKLQICAGAATRAGSLATCVYALPTARADCWQPLIEADLLFDLIELAMSQIVIYANFGLTFAITNPWRLFRTGGNCSRIGK